MGCTNHVWPVSVCYFFGYNFHRRSYLDWFIIHRPFYSQGDLVEYFDGPHAYSAPYPMPLPYDDHERKQFRNLEPFQVFSCWNGAAVIDPLAFVSVSSDVGRAAPEAGLKNDKPKGSQMLFDPLDSKSNIDAVSDGSSIIRFRTARNDASSTTEKASECFLFCVDLWRKGMGRILLVPRARYVTKFICL